MKSRYFLFAILLFVLSGCSTSEREQSVILPAPQSVTYGAGALDLSESLRLAFDCTEECRVTLEAVLADEEIRTTEKDDAPQFKIAITDDPALPQSEEGYVLRISEDGVSLAARGDAGLFYGLQSFVQLAKAGMKIPAQTITDAPRFAYRGLMLDVSRHFNTKDFVIKQLRMMAQLKLNRLHLHLTDAAGWRLEIDRYPELTDIAAWRIGKTWTEWQDAGRRYAHRGAKDAEGGYFSKDDIREILAAAHRLHIEVIPEIEMPGHSEEVLAVFPELSCTGEAYKHGEFCIGNEKTFTFLENVLTEVIDLFPSEYIHIGGDEAGKSAWKVCPKCQQRMREEGLKSEDELQSYAIKRIEKFLIAHHRRLLGWDEILEGGLAPEATVMSWRGEEGGRKAAAAGHDVIMTPGSHCYFDGYQDNPEQEPQAMSGYLPLKKVYAYDPAPQDMEGREYVLGVQANLWTEFVPTPEHTEYMLYPRLFALAEVAWSDPAKKDYGDFHRRAEILCDRAVEEGYHAFDLRNEYGERPLSLAEQNHLAVGCPVTYNCQWSEKYAAEGAASLTNGLHGSWNYGTRWQGFLSQDFEVVIDLGAVKELSEVTADFIQWNSAWIWLPKQVTISVSDDGKTFRDVAVVDHHISPEERRPLYMTFGWKGTDRGRYIRYTAEAQNKAGGWLFTDEISVY